MKHEPGFIPDNRPKPLTKAKAKVIELGGKHTGQGAWQHAMFPTHRAAARFIGYLNGAGGGYWEYIVNAAPKGSLSIHYR